MVGVVYSPPVQSGKQKYWFWRTPASAYRTTLVPLSAYPYLCVSRLMDVTPSTEKSKAGVS